MTHVLTDKQALLLDFLFSDEYIDNPRAAANAAGYSPNSSLATIMVGIKEEILDRTDKYLSLHTAKSAKSIIDVMNSPDQKGAKTKLEAAGMVLDRAGLTKKERVEVDVKSSNAVLILPTKKDN